MPSDPSRPDLSRLIRATVRDLADQADAADRRGDVAIAELLLSTALRLAESVFSPADVPSAP